MSRLDGYATTSSILRALLCALASAFFVLSCDGGTKANTTGETHFLGACPDGTCNDGLECLGGVCTMACTHDDDCNALGTGLLCETGRCNQPATAATASDAGTVSADDVDAADGAPPSSCAPGCRLVVGHPVDGLRHCVDLTPQGIEVGCDCSNGVSYGDNCVRRTSDATLWLYAADNFNPLAGFVACSDQERVVAVFSCDFASCPAGTTSYCSRAGTCAGRPCVGPFFDENGCTVPACSSDGDCPTDQRCAPIRSSDCADDSYCELGSDGSCNCDFHDLVCRSISLCTPVSSVGPRGIWQELDVVVGAGPCPAGQPCTSTWKVTPDWAVAANKNGVASNTALPFSVQSMVTNAVNGPDLRVGLRDGFNCDPPPTDVSVTFRLVLDTMTLERDVTGCATSGPDNNVVKQVFNLVTATY